MSWMARFQFATASVSNHKIQRMRLNGRNNARGEVDGVHPAVPPGLVMIDIECNARARTECLWTAGGWVDGWGWIQCTITPAVLGFGNRSRPDNQRVGFTGQRCAMPALVTRRDPAKICPQGSRRARGQGEIRLFGDGCRRAMRVLSDAWDGSLPETIVFLVGVEP